MILADSSIWIQSFKQSGVHPLHNLLANNLVTMHTMVLGELALGSLASRQRTLEYLKLLPHTLGVRHIDVMGFIELHRIFSQGIGYVDCHLLVSAHINPSTKLWTRDNRLRAVAEQMGVSYQG